MKIPHNQFLQLKTNLAAVIRNEKGDIVDGRVGNIYSLQSSETGERIIAKVTQDCPVHFRLIDENQKYIY